MDFSKTCEMDMQLNQPNVASPETGVDESGFQWPLAFMVREDFRQGEFLFRAGDRADKLYLIVKGFIRLPELNRVMKPGQVLGELGIFSPGKQRSASALAEQDVQVYAMGSDQVRRLFTQNPALAVNLIEISVKRLTEHVKAEVEARERINAELRVAREIQVSMLPRVFPPFPNRKEFELWALMEPANEVGGDFYDFFFVGEKQLCVLIGDASGKGVPAALLMALCKTLLKSEAMRGYSASEMLARVNNLICPENQECMFVTVFCLLLNTGTGEIECATAGHNPPLLCSSDGATQLVSPEPGPVIGFEENATYESKRIRLNPGDMLFLYTDGVIEAENPNQEAFSLERFRSCANALRAREMRDVIAGARQDIARHTQGQSQSDDITLLALRYCGTTTS
jgi:serine phosphatase RsbU (regulator of sigma subunit)